ncbi:MAG TPA: hypothetical protein VL947_04160, partial [Cytophagales bacterium]|nr:hypothetical protein [Cytophagales bacterium]
MKNTIFLTLIIFGMLQSSVAQYLKPGFSVTEYIELLKISARCIEDSSYYSQVGEPTFFKKVYRSKPIGLDNLWELWIDPVNSVATISIRGTTAQSVSWMANYYAAMVPAKGELQLSKTDKFSYQLAH